MTCDDGEWPYLEADSDVESHEHVRLKNHAVQYLLDQGFDRENIAQEVRYGSGRVDVVALKDGVGVFVECETDSNNPLSEGAKDAFRSGEDVLVVQTDGVYRVTTEERKLRKTDPFGNEYSRSDDSPYEVRVRRRIADLPPIEQGTDRSRI